MKENRLYRIVNGRVIGGVAGGLAEFFGIDPTIIRIIFILLTIMGGGGLLIYIVLWIVVPQRFNTIPPYSTGYTKTPPYSGTTSGVGETYEGFESGKPFIPKADPPSHSNKLDGGLIAGLVLILIGSFFLFEKFFPQIGWSDFWPLLLVLIGLLMIARGFPVTKKTEEPVNPENDNANTTNNDLNL